MNYESPKPKAKLFMSPCWSSMKKKSKIGYNVPQEERVESIVLFEVMAEEGEEETKLRKIDLGELSEEECHTPKRKG